MMPPRLRYGKGVGQYGILVSTWVSSALWLSRSWSSWKKYASFSNNFEINIKLKFAGDMELCIYYFSFEILLLLCLNSVGLGRTCPCKSPSIPTSPAHAHLSENIIVLTCTQGCPSTWCTVQMTDLNSLGDPASMLLQKIFPNTLLKESQNSKSKRCVFHIWSTQTVLDPSFCTLCC